MKIKLCIIVFLISFYPTIGNSHQDPLGDIYPIVQIEGNYFVIYYYNNTRGPYEYPAYKTVINNNGYVVHRRLQSKYPKCLSENEDLLGDEKGVIAEYGGNQYIFADSYKYHKGEPVLIKIIKGKKERLDIRWKEKKIYIIHNVLIQDDKAIILYTKADDGKKDINNNECEKELFNMNDKPVVFSMVDIAKGKEIQNTFVGSPERYRVVPTMSNIISYKEKVYVSWVERDKKGFWLNLSSWNIKNKEISKIKTRLLEGSNISISIANIDNKLLIAYHEKGEIKYFIEEIR